MPKDKSFVESFLENKKLLFTKIITYMLHIIMTVQTHTYSIYYKQFKMYTNR